MAAFSLDAVVVDNNAGWGPSLDSVLVTDDDIPYAPFSKSDRLGRVADWNSSGSHARWASQQRARDREFRSNIITAFNAFDTVDDEGEDFEMVDNRPVFKPNNYNKNRWGNKGRNSWRRNNRFNNNNTAAPKKGLSKEQKKILRPTKTRWAKYKAAQRGNRGWWNRVIITRDSSVDVQANWEIVEEFEVTAFPSLRGDVPEVETLYEAGAVGVYKRTYDSVRARKDVKLYPVAPTKAFFQVSTTDDPVMQKFAEENAGTVFGTDVIFAAIMTASRSVNSFDIIIERVGDKLFFDKRDGSPLDLLTVNETAYEPPTDEKDPNGINNPRALSLEAAAVNRSFAAQVIDGKAGVTALDNEHPFVTDESDIASVGYRYRRVDLGDGLVLVYRGEYDCVLPEAQGSKSVAVHALNEYDPRVSSIDWRAKLDSQPGAVLATELKNNSAKLARWAASALLSDVEVVKLGYVSRINPNRNNSHTVLGTQTYRATELAKKIDLHEDNMWSVLRIVVSQCMALPEGKYVFLKDPNKTIVRIYSVPNSAFDEDAGGDGYEQGNVAGIEEYRG